MGAIATGLFAGCAYGLLIADGNLVAAIFATVVAGGVIALAFLMDSHHVPLAPLIALAFATQLAVTAVMHAGLVAVGRGGFVTGDDREYALVSWGLAQTFHGLPSDVDLSKESYAIGTFAYIEAGLFYLFGPDVLLAKILNGGFLMGAALLTFEWTRRLFGPSAGYLAAILVAFFPSLVLWSSLNLKDTLALVLGSGLLWALQRFQLRRQWPLLFSSGLALVPIAGLHGDFVIVLAVAIAAAALMAPGLVSPRVRLIVVAAPIACLVVALALDLAGARHRGAQALQRIELLREGNAEGVRTAIVEPLRRVPVMEGDTFVVSLPGASPTGAGVPTPTPLASALPNVVYALPGARIAPSVPSTSNPPAEPADVIFAASGDLLVVGASGRPPAELSQRRPLTIEGGGIQLVSTEDDFGVLRRTLLYLPRGIAYALFAPFAWAISRTADLLTVPDMFLWYVLIVAAGITAWSRRSLWPYLLPAYVVVVLGLLAFALAEGNVGTLYRHRSMIIPATIALASPSLVGFGRRIGALLARR